MIEVIANALGIILTVLQLVKVLVEYIKNK